MPGNETAIQPGMVFSIESGSYEGIAGTVGARVEKSVVVTRAAPRSSLILTGSFSVRDP